MNGFKKTARIIGGVGSNIITFPGFTEGDLPLPANILNFQLGYGTIISLNCIQDISNVSFTITGMFNNIQVSEIMVGPNSGSTISKYFYDKIISISASTSSVETMYIGVSSGTIIFLDNADVSLANSYNLNKFSILASSLAVNNEGWYQANYFVYGVNGTRPSLITVDSVTPNLVYQDVEPFALERAYPSTPNFHFINDPLYMITQDDLQNGYLVTTDYPYDSIIVYVANNIVQTPSIIEIAQS